MDMEEKHTLAMNCVVAWTENFLNRKHDLHDHKIRFEDAQRARQHGQDAIDRLEMKWPSYGLRGTEMKSSKRAYRSSQPEGC